MFRKSIALLLVFVLSIGLVLVPAPDSAQASVPSPWQEADIGSPAIAGSSSYSDGTFTVAGAGSDIYNNSDQFRFVYQPLSGNGTITARVVSITNTHSWAKGAVMIRESLAANSVHAMTLISYSQGAQFSRRTTTGGSTATTNHTGVSAPYWVKLERNGNTFTSSISSDGVNWTTIGSQTISMATNVYIGLAVTSVNVSQLNTVVFDNVTVTGVDTEPPTKPTNLTVTGKTDTTVSLSWTASTDNVGVTGYRIYHSGSVLAGTTNGATSATVTNLTPNTAYTFTVKAIDAAQNESEASDPVTVTTDPAPGGLPSPWLTQDIGSPALAGSATYSGGTFTVAGAGTDIYNNSDQFRFVYQPLSGDGAITARVESITNTSSWAKGAVMIRESLAADSKHAMTLIMYSQGAQFSRRTTTGGSTATTNHTGVSAPYWVRLERSGNTFTSSISSDGVNWTTIGSQTISMATNVYIGLAVTSVNVSQLNTVKFTNVTVGVPVPDTEPPTKPTNLTVTGKTDKTVSLSWSASTDNVGVTGYRIYHSGTVLAGTTNGATTATVTNLAPNTTYTFTVTAVDWAQNESEASDPVTVTTDATPSFWLSGGSRNINSYNGLLEWENFRGRPNTFQTVFSTRDAGWSAFVSTHGSAGQIAHYQDPDVTVMIQTAPFPTGVGATYAKLVNGDYDTYWQQIGTQLKNRADAGLPVIISIAWEMNGEYMYWGCGSGSEKYSSPSQYIAAYRRIVNNLRVTYPDVETAWIINAHATPTTCVSNGDAWQLYPGDEYVTYIGIDNYDMYPPAFTKEQFDNIANANGGLYWLANHARQRGKRIIVGEWGIAPGAGPNGGGDNPNFIQWMFETFQAWHSEGLLKAEYYFADPIGGGNVDSDLIGGNPLSRAKYVSLYQM